MRHGGRRGWRADTAPAARNAPAGLAGDADRQDALLLLLALLLLSALLERSGFFGWSSIQAALLGTNIGPNLTLSGLLATLLVLTAARKKGESIRALDFFKVSLLVTPLILLTAGLALWLTFRLLP